MPAFTARSRPGLIAGCLALMASSAFAQNWSGDARHIAMGGAGTSENIASESIREERGYRTIVIPLGLFQVLKDTDIFDPDSDEFDPLRTIEYAASPLHFTFERDGTGTGAAFVSAIRNGELNRDLNAYRGFVPVSQPVAYGLANPSFGVTIPVFRTDAVRHGIYVGAGPYFSMRGALSVDQQLVDILSSETNVYIANAQMPIDSAVAGQAALAITGGYRGQFRSAGSTNDVDGVYVAANYHWLRGFRYESADIGVRFETDANGLLTLTPASPIPIGIVRDSADTGRGFALDFGAALVSRGWEFGFGANGVANRIEWEDVERRAYALSNLLLLGGGGGWTESAPVPQADRRVELPVEYTGHVGYHADNWSALGQVSERVSSAPEDEDRFEGTTVRFGGEYRFTVLEPRAGAYYTRERWQPSVGLGLNFGGFGIDTALYWTDVNVQRERHATFAASLRFGRRGQRF